LETEAPDHGPDNPEGSGIPCPVAWIPVPIDQPDKKIDHKGHDGVSDELNVFHGWVPKFFPAHSMYLAVVRAILLGFFFGFGLAGALALGLAGVTGCTGSSCFGHGAPGASTVLIMVVTLFRTLMTVAMALVAGAAVVHAFARAITGAANRLVVIFINEVFVWILRINV
jgi:hypothetical protein